MMNLPEPLETTSDMRFLLA